MSLKKLQEEIIAQVSREYSQGEQHTRDWRTQVQAEVTTLKDNIPDGKIKIDLVKENIDFERATFLTDDIDVKFVSDEWVLGKEIMDNANKVSKYDYIDTVRKDLKDQIIIDNGYYWVAVEVLDMYDSDENQPISSLVAPDTVIPDPKCQRGSFMRFVWFERRIPTWQIEDKKVFDLGWMVVMDMSDTSSTLRQSDESIEPTSIVASSDGLVAIYDHYTVHNGMKYLTTWINDRSILVRAVPLEPLTKAEKANPMKVRYPVIFHRRRSHPYRWAGYRMREEVGNTEDIVTQLTNLEIAQARIATYGPDTFVDATLGIDIGSLQKKKPGWLIQGVNVPQGSNIGNHIFQKQYDGNINLAQAVSQTLLDRVKRNTGYTDITMWVSPSGQQTKWEIQTLQNNANKTLAWVSDSYLWGEKEFYTLWYRSYQENMSPKSKKTIALFDNGGLSKSLTKKEFISDGKVIIDIRSAAQEEIQNTKSVTKLLALAQSILPNLKSEQSINTFLRTIIDKSEVPGLDGLSLVPYSVDETLAISRLRLINNDIEVMSPPEAGEDLKTHIDIYEQALDTPAKKKLLSAYKQAFAEQSQNVPPPMATTDQSSGNIAMNSMSQQNNPATSPLPSM